MNQWFSFPLPFHVIVSKDWLVNPYFIRSSRKLNLAVLEILITVKISSSPYVSVGLRNRLIQGNLCIRIHLFLENEVDTTIIQGNSIGPVKVIRQVSAQYELRPETGTEVFPTP